MGGREKLLLCGQIGPDDVLALAGFHGGSFGRYLGCEGRTRGDASCGAEYLVDLGEGLPDKPLRYIGH